MEMIELDCLGDICPVPAIRLKETLKALPKGESILLVTDHSCVLNSIESICHSQSMACESNEVINGVWEISITPLEED